MIKCRNHPDIDTPIVCQKNDSRGYCPQCLEEGAPCFDPEVYCKFRSQCVIWELAREKGLHRQSDEAAEGG